MPDIVFENPNSGNNLPCRFYQNYPSSKHDFSSNWHNELEFIYTLSGTEIIYIENDCYIINPGDLLVINRGRIHTITGTDWTHHCLIPSNELLQSLGVDHTKPIQPLIQDPKISEAFLKIFRELDSLKKYSNQFQLLAIQRFLLLVFEKYEINQKADSSATSNPNFAVTVKVIDYLRQHLSEDFSIDAIANEIGITSSYMCRCVKAATGVSIIDHLNMIRCYTAKHYLMHSDKKISEIAALCGYRSNSYFSKTYQKIVGYAPNETPRNSQTNSSGSSE